MREVDKTEVVKIDYSAMTDRQLIDIWFEASNIKFEIERGGNGLLCRGVFYLDVINDSSFELWARGTVVDISDVGRSDED